MTDAEIQDLFIKLIAEKIYIKAYAVDSWDSWSYVVMMEDAMSPFFVAHECEQEFSSYMDALRHGIYYMLEPMQTAKIAD